MVLLQNKKERKQQPTKEVFNVLPTGTKIVFAPAWKGIILMLSDAHTPLPSASGCTDSFREQTGRKGLEMLSQKPALFGSCEDRDTVTRIS